MAKATASPTFKDRVNPTKKEAPLVSSSRSRPEAPEAASALRDDPRPYYTPGSPPTLPTVAVFEEIYRRAHVCNGDLLGAEADALRSHQKKIKELQKRISELSVHGIVKIRSEAKERIRRGRASQSDIEAVNDKQSLIVVRKALKRELSAALSKVTPLVVAVAGRVESAARRALPELEREAARLGIAPIESPIVRGIGAGCWTPTRDAASLIESPGRFLKRLGIRL